MDWNDETIARIRELWAEGHSTAEIGRRMGVTKNAVVGKAHRLQLPPRPSPIRRVPGEAHVARRAVPKRAVGSTLPELAQPASPRPEAASPRPEPQPVPLRPVSLHPVPAGPVLVRSAPSQPRSVGRLSACCWPLGEPGTPSFRFCGDPALPSKPYCTEHAAIAYVKVRDRREDAA